MACLYLKRLGYRIVNRNWRFSRAEIDIIALKRQTLVFVEVKTRRSDLFEAPERHISIRKEMMMLDAANEYIRSTGHLGPLRFDAIAVIGRDKYNFRLRHTKDTIEF